MPNESNRVADAAGCQTAEASARDALLFAEHAGALMVEAMPFIENPMAKEWVQKARNQIAIPILLLRDLSTKGGRANV